MIFNHRTVAFAILRLALGINIFGHGFFRILSGPAKFAAGMAADMSKSPLPAPLIHAFGYCIPWIELVLGLLLIIGLATRLALVLGGLLMISLTFGTTSIQNWGSAGQQLQYSVVFFILLWLVEANSLSLDALISNKGVSRHATNDSP